MLPGCRSAWKKPSRNTCLKNAPAALRSKASTSCPAAISAVAVVDPDAADALGRQHGAAGAQPIDPRHPKARIAGEILGQLGGGGRLEAQIHFELHRLRQRFDDLDRLQPAQMRLGALGETRQPQEQVEVARQRAGDPGPQHLDRDFRALGRDREMHLRDRGGGDRGIVERGEEARRAAARIPPRSARAPARRETAAAGPAIAPDLR